MRIHSIFFLLALLPAGAALAHGRPAKLPLGDGKLSFAPLRGHIYSCQTSFAGGGAFRDGPWIQGAWWYPDGKIRVGGSVPWPQARFRMERYDAARVLRGNGLPVNQTTGIYPVRADDEAYQYDRNPNSITEQAMSLELPLLPMPAKKPSCVPMGLIGMTLTGVGIFNGLDGMGRDAAAHEIQDKCNGHPERRGQYHYHNWSNCIPDAGGDTGGHSDLVGYVLDGHGIFGPRGEGGKILTNADLDACHGHQHKVPWDGKTVDIYHYHFTLEYPYSVGCFVGTPLVLPHGPDAPSMMPGGMAPPPYPKGKGFVGKGFPPPPPYPMPERYPPPPPGWAP